MLTEQGAPPFRRLRRHLPPQAGEGPDCTYTSTDKEIALNCPTGPGELKMARHDDGSLSGPPGGAMPILSKKKE